MSSFKDKLGDEWKLDLDVGLIEDIKDQSGVDLDSVLQNPEEIATVIFSEPKKLVGLLWVMCQEQCKERKLEPRDFGRRFDRDSLDRASNAFLESIIRFYPRGAAGRTLIEELPGILKRMDERIVVSVRKSAREVLSDTVMN